MQRMTRARPGVTLVELIVAMTVGGIVLALVATISVRQQRLHADLTDRLAIAEELRQASAVLPIELRGLSVGAGDLRDARDTAVEFRSTIASGVVCDTTSGTLVLAPAARGASTFSGFLTPIADGDTAWILTPDSVDRWRPFAIASVSSVAGGLCDRSGPRLDAVARAIGRVSLTLVAGPLPEPSIGSVVRVTRPMRYSLYRGGDSRWYLGARDWNAVANRFNTTQPVSDPFLSASNRGLEFQYLDSAGTPLARPVLDTRAVAMIRIDVRAQTRHAMRAFGVAPRRASDSAAIALSMRNRR